MGARQPQHFWTVGFYLVGNGVTIHSTIVLRGLRPLNFLSLSDSLNICGRSGFILTVTGLLCRDHRCFYVITRPIKPVKRTGTGVARSARQTINVCVYVHGQILLN